MTTLDIGADNTELVEYYTSETTNENIYYRVGKDQYLIGQRVTEVTRYVNNGDLYRTIIIKILPDHFVELFEDSRQAIEDAKAWAAATFLQEPSFNQTQYDCTGQFYWNNPTSWRFEDGCWKIRQSGSLDV